MQAWKYESQDLDSVPTLPLGTMSLWEKSLTLFKQPLKCKNYAMI